MIIRIIESDYLDQDISPFKQDIGSDNTHPQFSCESGDGNLQMIIVDYDDYCNLSISINDELFEVTDTFSSCLRFGRDIYNAYLTNPKFAIKIASSELFANNY